MPSKERIAKLKVESQKTLQGLTTCYDEEGNIPYHNACGKDCNDCPVIFKGFPEDALFVEKEVGFKMLCYP